MGVTHTFTNPKADGGDATIVRPSNWNAVHTFDGQLAFPATQFPSADANVLDDYEEGAFTPVFEFETPGTSNIVHSSQQGRYVRVGRKVDIWYRVETSTFTIGTAAGRARVTGYPFTASSGLSYLMPGALLLENFTASSAAWIISDVATGTAYGEFVMAISGAGSTTLTTSYFTSGVNIGIFAHICYEI